MAVRKIPKNHLVVTGRFASRKNGQMDEFESLLEKEYMLLLDFDERVERFEAQPITIPVSGIAKGYTPDILVHFRSDLETGDVRKPLLTEIKHTGDLRRNIEKYTPKFRAAEEFAKERDWEFQITTEVDIRTPRLANIKFLREYRNVEPGPGDLSTLFEIVDSDGGNSSVAQLLQRLAACDDDRLRWLPVIWHALLHRHLICDLDKPLDHDVVLHLAREQQ